MCHQPLEKRVKTKTIKANKNRCNSAVSAKPLQSQQTQQKALPKPGAAEQINAAAARRYRPSSTSATMRIPHELRTQVAAIVARYREQHRNDPDRW
jgi:hypothetical protein